MNKLLQGRQTCAFVKYVEVAGIKGGIDYVIGNDNYEYWVHARRYCNVRTESAAS